MEKKNIDVPSVTFTGDITIQGDMFNMHDIENVNFYGSFAEALREMAAKGHSAASPAVAPATVEDENHEAEELCHFVHPSIDSSKEWEIHEEIKRLVRRQGIQEICAYLKQMAAEKKILLPPMPSTAYAELVRMGMPTGEGFNESTFRKYYNK